MPVLGDSTIWMLAALRNLERARKEELISDEEYAEQKKQILSRLDWSDAPAPTQASCDAAKLVTSLKSTVDKLVGCVAHSVVENDDGHSRRKTPSNASAKYPRPVMTVKPLARALGQCSIMDGFATVLQTRSDGRVVELQEADIRSPVQHGLRCSFVGCNRVFSMSAHRANHEKKAHKGGMQRPRSITEMQSVRSVMGKAQVHAAVTAECRFIVDDLLRRVFEECGAAGGWSADGRKSNSGTSGIGTRVSRSWGMKKKVVLSFEKYLTKYAEYSSDVSRHVANLHGVTPNQVRT